MQNYQAPQALSSNPRKAAQEMEVILKAMIDFFTRENDVLSRTSAREFQALQAEKMALFSKYESAHKQMLARQEEIKAALSEDERATLKALKAELNTLTSDNQKQLQSIANASNRLLETLQSEAKKEIAKHAHKGYSSSGYAQAQTSSRNMSIGIMQNV